MPHTDTDAGTRTPLSSESPESPALRTVGIPRNLYNLIVLSLAFFFIFAAFVTAQAFATPLLGHLGTISLLVLYVSNCLGSVVAPYIARRLGGPTALIAAATTFALFVASFIYLVTPVLVVIAAVVGVGAAVLWTAHGVVMTQVSDTGNFNTARMIRVH
jgi:Na+/melibiose symporter-like transporter